MRVIMPHGTDLMRMIGFQANKPVQFNEQIETAELQAKNCHRRQSENLLHRGYPQSFRLPAILGANFHHPPLTDSVPFRFPRRSTAPIPYSSSYNYPVELSMARKCQIVSRLA